MKSSAGSTTRHSRAARSTRKGSSSWKRSFWLTYARLLRTDNLVVSSSVLSRSHVVFLLSLFFSGLLECLLFDIVMEQISRALILYYVCCFTCSHTHTTRCSTWSGLVGFSLSPFFAGFFSSLLRELGSSAIGGYGYFGYLDGGFFDSSMEFFVIFIPFSYTITVERKKWK